jgi:hypothetical protein
LEQIPGDHDAGGDGADENQDQGSLPTPFRIIISGSDRPITDIEGERCAGAAFPSPEACIMGMIGGLRIGGTPISTARGHGPPGGFAIREAMKFSGISVDAGFDRDTGTT